MRKLLLAIAALLWIAPTAAQVPVVAPLPPSLSGPQAKMLKVLRSAARGMTPIVTVMTTPPTITVGAANTASTINGASTAFGAATYSIGDTTRFEQVSGQLTSTGSAWSGTGKTSNTSGTRGGTIGEGVQTCTDAQNIDFGLASPSGVAIYVTDLTTGIRARVSAADIVADAGTPANTLTDSSQHYVKLAFTTRAPRQIAVYGTNTSLFRGANTDASASVWRCPLADQVNLILQWDSWGFGTLSSGTNALRLSTPFYIAERLGVANPWSIASAGTGVLNPGGSNGTYGFRMSNGDMTVSTVGDADLVVVSPSVNDDPGVNAAYTDAAFQPAWQAFIAQVMAAQPTAPIIVFGCQQTTLNRTPAASRCQATIDGTNAAAGGDPRVIIVNVSDIYGLAARNSLMIGTDNTHPNDLGKVYYGARFGQAIVDAMRARLLSAYGITAANDNLPYEDRKLAA